MVDALDIAELSKFGISQTLINRLGELGYRKLTTVQEQAVNGGIFGDRLLTFQTPSWF
jgi:superfamily II DNA/RNA helicase